MKKHIITTLAAGALSASAFGQGTLYMNQTLANNPGVALQGTSANSPTAASAYYTGTISLEVFALASATQAQLNAINAYINTTGGATSALNLATADGFAEVSTTTLGGTTIGAVTGGIQDGSMDFTVNSDVGLANVTTSSTEALLLYAVEVGGANPGYAGVIAFNNNVGGSPFATPPGTAAPLTGWGTLDQNLVLAANVPEPTTMALAGLGSLSLFLFRRKK